MAHDVTWLDRLRIERVVWTLDQRLYDLPRRTRIQTRREVRQNLLTGARDVGTTQALRNLGGSAELAQEYLAAAYGAGPRHSWVAAGVFFFTVPLLATSFFADAATAFASGITAARSRRHWNVLLGWNLARAEHRHVHIRRRRRYVDGRSLHAFVLRPLDHGDDPRGRPRRALPAWREVAPQRLRLTQEPAMAGE